MVLPTRTNGWGHAPDPHYPPDPVSSIAAREPAATRATVQDDSSYTKLPQIMPRYAMTD